MEEREEEQERRGRTKARGARREGSDRGDRRWCSFILIHLMAANSSPLLRATKSHSSRPPPSCIQLLLLLLILLPPPSLLLHRAVLWAAPSAKGCCIHGLRRRACDLHPYVAPGAD